jgi:hypothetical protein
MIELKELSDEMFLTREYVIAISCISHSWTFLSETILKVKLLKCDDKWRATTYSRVIHTMYVARKYNDN